MSSLLALDLTATNAPVIYQLWEGGEWVPFVCLFLHIAYGRFAARNGCRFYVHGKALGHE
jgi:hypothetical protein